MPENDSYRVEMHLGLVGRGSGTTPERIKELELRRSTLEKVRPAKPSIDFATVLGQSSKPADKAESKLPKKGPRPSLAHPGQRQAFGRDEDIVIKG